ncbi:hypothetical protein AVEN_127545-1 [Araneus ventricosus]|uniref:Uncharacterized protein n=1 Tax=Araneus ventricosus TaxID=182803 RepID=A0A4Y2BYK0_ARAVE|nr:hypothetical protein AVEN_127545-1 [Araneus ventricosus]
MRMTSSKDVPVAGRKMVHYEVGQGMRLCLLGIQVKIQVVSLKHETGVVEKRGISESYRLGSQYWMQAACAIEHQCFHNAIGPIYRRYVVKHST